MRWIEVKSAPRRERGINVVRAGMAWRLTQWSHDSPQARRFYGLPYPQLTFPSLFGSPSSHLGITLPMFN
jgi:hypothetical protein